MKKPLYLAFIVSVLIFSLGILATILVYESGDSKSLVPWVENGVLIISFVISFVAFIISMSTYFAIDVLGSITAMDGNVLDNEEYSVAYEEMISYFKNCKDEDSFYESLMNKIEFARKTKSCIVFADYLQNILDHIILFAYVDFKNENKKRRIDKLINKISKEAKRYSKLSNGVKYQLEENVKLISYILDYQKIRSGKADNNICKLENIRGTMLKNPISKILYYDYLGLDYRRKAADLIKGSLTNSCKEEFTAKNMLQIKELFFYDKRNETKKKVLYLLERAEYCFLRAQEIGKDNILWDGYISYNVARVDIMKYLVGEGKSTDYIYEELENVIQTREKVAFLFDLDNSYLKEMFSKEIQITKNLEGEFKKVNEISQCNN